MDEGTERADFLAFLALDSREGLSAGPCVGGCLEDNFLFVMDFLRADRVGSEGGSAGAVPLLAAGALGEPCSPGLISRSLREDPSGEKQSRQSQVEIVWRTHSFCVVFGCFEWLSGMIFL